ncbi:MAG: protein kinase [Gemmatimonadaceae bacterium]|nr:protein kinase [Gemmatimonadaceae bacterium]
MTSSLSLSGANLSALELFTEGAGSTRIYRGLSEAGAPVCIKVIPRKNNAKQLDTQRRYFLEEKALVKQVAHPNLRLPTLAIELDSVRELGALTPNGAFIFVYPWIERSLREHMDNGCLAPSAVLELGAALASGLDALHGCKPPYLHRDVKPENVLVPEAGYSQAVLSDFGILRRSGDENTTALFRGTQRYMPPEQFKGIEAQGVELDVYSLALVLWEALTGEVPLFDPQLDAFDLLQLRSDPPELPALRVDGRDCEFMADVFESALAPDPAERPGSAGELIVLLREAASRDGLHALTDDGSGFSLPDRWESEDNRASGGAFWVEASSEEESELRRLTPGIEWKYSRKRSAWYTMDKSTALRTPDISLRLSAPTRPPATRKIPDGAVPFLKPVRPNDKLARIVGPSPLPRTELTTRLWAYIKRKGLQDKKNRRMINADDALRDVFGGRSQVSMFDMTKLVSRNLIYDDE